MTIQHYNPGKGPGPSGYSHAVRAGNTVYVSGQVALDENGRLAGPGDVSVQVERVIQNLQRTLEPAGGTLNDVVKLTTYVTNPVYGGPVIAARSRHFSQNPPASTLLVVNALARPEFLVEIEAIAALSPKQKRHIGPAGLPGQKPSYSQAVQADDILYVSGQIARAGDGRIVGPGDLKAQAEQTLSNVVGMISQAGGNIGRTAMVRNFLVNPLLFPPFLDVYLKHVGQPYPANTSVMVSALALPELLVETEAVVSLSRDVEFIEPAWKGKPPVYTMAARVGNTVYVSGQVSRNREGVIVGQGNIAAQVEQAFQNLGIVLAEAGAGYKDVVKLNAYVTNAEFFAQYSEGRKRFFPTDPPASTTAVVPALARPDFLVEIEAVAAVG